MYHRFLDAPNVYPVPIHPDMPIYLVSKDTVKRSHCNFKDESYAMSSPENILYKVEKYMITM